MWSNTVIALSKEKPFAERKSKFLLIYFILRNFKLATTNWVTAESIMSYTKLASGKYSLLMLALEQP